MNQSSSFSALSGALTREARHGGETGGEGIKGVRYFFRGDKKPRVISDTWQVIRRKSVGRGPPHGFLRGLVRPSRLEERQNTARDTPGSPLIRISSVLHPGLVGNSFSRRTRHMVQQVIVILCDVRRQQPASSTNTQSSSTRSITLSNRPATS